MNGVSRPLIEKLYAKKNKWLKWHLWRKLWVSRNSCTLFYGIRNHRTQFLYAIFHCRIGVFIYERSRVEDRMKSERKKRTYRIKEQIKFAIKLTITHLFYTISIATNKTTFLNAFDFSGHPSSGCDEICNKFINAMGYSCQWILSVFGTNHHQHDEVSCIMTSKNRSSMVKET